MNIFDFFQHASPTLALTLAVVAFAIVGGFVLDLLAAALAGLMAIRGSGRSNLDHQTAQRDIHENRISAHCAVTAVTLAANEPQ